MRLSRPVYESLPLLYAAIGGLAIAIAYVDPAEPQSLICLTIGLFAEIAALTVFLRRQDHRAFRREYSGEPIESPRSFIR